MKYLPCVLLVLGCYSPNLPPGMFECRTDFDCPDIQRCVQGVCGATFHPDMSITDMTKRMPSDMICDQISGVCCKIQVEQITGQNVSSYTEPTPIICARAVISDNNIWECCQGDKPKRIR